MPKIHILRDDIYYYSKLNDYDLENTLLARGLEHGFNLPYSCNKGKCGACKCKVLHGEINLYGEYNPLALSAQEKDQGYTLLCRAYAKTDLAIELPSSVYSPPVKIFSAFVLEIIKLGEVAIVKLQIPIERTFDFLPGQYIDIRFPGHSRSYSIANIAGDNKVELHIKNNHTKGSFSEFIWEQLHIDDTLKFKGPLGWFGVSSWVKPMILVCTGTGFAPVKAIIEQWLIQVKQNRAQPLYLYWGNARIVDFYLLDLVQSWMSIPEIKDLFKVKLCLSQDEGTEFFQGHVTHALQADFTDLSNYDLYACGGVEMIKDVHKLAIHKLGLNRKNFFCDRFIQTSIV